MSSGKIIPDLLSYSQRIAEGPLAVHSTISKVLWSIPDDWDKLREQQLADESLKPLWEEALKKQDPGKIHCDGERLLTWSVIAEQQWGVVQKLTTAYHPQTNLTEWVN